MGRSFSLASALELLASKREERVSDVKSSKSSLLKLEYFYRSEMDTQLQPLRRFQDYVSKTTDTDYGLGSLDEDGDYAARLSKTLSSLQNQVKQHEAALEKVCSRLA